MRFVLLFTLLTCPALADQHGVFFGIWGTEAQCNREPIIEGGTRLAEPTELSKQFLRQGDLWCRLNWGAISDRDTDQFTMVNALCGEDSVRGYFIGITLKDDTLTLRWDFLSSKTTQMRRCGNGG